MLEDHRSKSRHDALLKVRHEDDGDNAWMVSYIDIMTLLVALFVIIIVAAEAANPGWLVASRVPQPEEEPMRSVPRLEIPLPEPLAELRQVQQLQQQLQQHKVMKERVQQAGKRNCVLRRWLTFAPIAVVA